MATLVEWSRPQAGREARGLLIVLFALALWISTPAALAQVRPFGTLDCVPQDGVRFCQGSIATAVESFDQTPLDVNVTLPATGDHNLPLLIHFHGWGGAKAGLMRDWASAGYAVLTFSARGFGDSCGSQASRDANPEGCERGWTHLSDFRYEIRDAQHLAGLLVDEGLVNKNRIAAIGSSYGGTESLGLATLRDTVMLDNGDVIPWESPDRRIRISLAAAVAIHPWSDFGYSLMPNGRYLDYAAATPADARVPVGVHKRSYSTWFFSQLGPDAYVAPQGADPSADFDSWATFFDSGEPYDPAGATQFLGELQRFHSAAYQAGAAPAPTFLAGGFTDALIPVDEQLRWMNGQSGAIVAQFYGDLGHDPAQKKEADRARRESLVQDWLAFYVKGNSSVTPPSGVEAWTQTCPATAPSGGPYNASSWTSLHPGEVRFRSNRAKVVLSSTDTLGASVDPLSGVGACGTTADDDQSGTATYRLPAARDAGYTLLGSPTVSANLSISTSFAPQDTLLAARLWDVAPDRTQTLVARTVYRPSASGRAVFQLHPNGWHFDQGHVPKLELLGQDTTYTRLPNFSFSMGVSNLELRLPTAEPPDSDQILSPLPPEYPAGATPVGGGSGGSGWPGSSAANRSSKPGGKR
jgi:hypothetical protein